MPSKSLLSLLSALLVTQLFSSGEAHQHRRALPRHDGVAKRQPLNPVAARDSNSSDIVYRLEKRFDNARFSFYDAGQGACGGYNSNADHIVALTHLQWDGGSHCGKTITITSQGKTMQAQIVDECMGCPYGGLDFSRGLMQAFVSNPDDVGIIYGQWDFGSSADADAAKAAAAAAQAKKEAAAKAQAAQDAKDAKEKAAKAAASSSSAAAAASSKAAASKAAALKLAASKSAASVASASATATPTASSDAPSATPTDSPQVLAQLETSMVNLANIMKQGILVAKK